MNAIIMSIKPPTSIVVAPFLFLLLVLAIAVALARMFTVMRVRYRSGGRSRQRHPAVRIACATTALCIFGTIGAGTWWSVNESYRAMRIEDATLVMPTKPTQPLAYKETDTGIQVEKARYLADVLLVIQGSGGTRIHVEHFDVRWPEDAGKRFSQTMNFEDIHTFQYHFVASGFEKKATHEAEPRLTADSHVTFKSRYKAFGFSEGSAAILTNPHDFRESVTNSDGNVKPVVSFGPVRTGNSVQIFTRFQRIEPDDPLMQVSAVQHLTNLGHHIESGIDYGHVREQVRSGLPAPLGLLAYGQFAFLLLLLAALLAAQCFRYRSLALPVALLGVVLYTAALDGMVVRMHVARGSDPAVTVEEKMLARSLVRQTFFWGETARNLQNE